ncbi:hypothetical protein HZH68_011034 [Vespula germanica]|uniref:EamA domain-containing protein n=1 Tax=Vespula germanica TaxID=30212 RepID=A0A834JMY1_VESGE|nr:hypothetical protein HZH68_011034 [Vespula germanica]
MEFVKEKDAELSTKFMEQGKTKIHLAVCSGILATCGSLFGKLAGGAEFVFLKPMLLKVSLLVLMVVTNTIGCTFFVKALNGSESSLPATVASTATNYVCSFERIHRAYISVVPIRFPRSSLARVKGVPQARRITDLRESRYNAIVAITVDLIIQRYSYVSTRTPRNSRSRDMSDITRTLFKNDAHVKRRRVACCIITAHGIRVTRLQIYTSRIHCIPGDIQQLIFPIFNNYQAFLGFIIFGESTSLTWWCGASLVILGLILICYTPNKEDSTSQQRKLKQQ